MADVTKHETKLTEANWKEIKKHAQPGDVLLLRHRPKKGKDCLLELIHLLDGPYDHVALVRSNDGKGTVTIAHVTATDVVCESLLDHVIALDTVKWVRAELRRRWLDDGDVTEIVDMADPSAWRLAHYGFGDLLLAALAASRRSPVRNRIEGRKFDERTLMVLRTRLLALCILDLNELEREERTAGVTCASFVNSCHDGRSALAGRFRSIDQRLKSLEHIKADAAAADRLVDKYRQRLKTTDMRHLLSEVLCPSAVAAHERAAKGQATHLIVQLLRSVEKLHAVAPARLTASGRAGRRAPDADRLLVTIEDLHTNRNLHRVWVEPHGTCRCEHRHKR